MWGCNYSGAGFGHWGFGGGIMGLSLTALIIIIAVVVVVKIIRSNQSGQSEKFDQIDSLKILKMRFAKGEIDEQEYQKKKDILAP
ncbi:MAG: SHOCT domain-containing protein [Desulfobacteraceae bacterium]|nr:SHOCT domain-containing protein [Desulfobacteraceae bacterium]